MFTDIVFCSKNGFGTFNKKSYLFFFFFFISFYLFIYLFIIIIIIIFFFFFFFFEKKFLLKRKKIKWSFSKRDVYSIVFCSKHSFGTFNKKLPFDFF